MSRNRWIGITVAIVVTLAASAFGYEWWRAQRYLVSTDDAYVQADVSLVTPRIPGTVVEIPVQEYWQVHAGDLLARLDPRDFDLQLRQAEASLALALQGVREARAAVRAAESEIEMAQAELELAELDDARVRSLLQQRVASSEAADRSRTTLTAARARVVTAREMALRARAALGIDPEASDDVAPAVRRAKAIRDQALLQKSYTEVVAPVDGVVDGKTVQLGAQVNPGQVLMRIVPLSTVYVEANFKETEMADVRVGQPARIVADLYPDVEFEGVVDSLAPGTGASMALLPPENATGNWIKVVQRLPVKIRLTAPPPADRPLRVGASVMATVDVHDTAGGFVPPLSQTAAASTEEGMR